MSPRAAIRVRDVWRALDDRYPFAHRADWDNVGILVGDPAAPVRRVLVSLDATPAALAACRRMRADLLVTHHPVVHTPLKSLRPDAPASAAACLLVRMGTAAISAHTNADVAPRGVSYALARRMGLAGIRPLVPGEPSDAYKLVAFVPPGSADAVLQAIVDAGGARIGAYSRCSFRSEGTGGFLPSEEARPSAGRTGREARVAEVRLETVVPGSLLDSARRAARAAHPYEEPAIDAYPLSGGALGGGVGAVGERAKPASLSEALAELAARVRPSWIKVAGPRAKTIRRVAVVGGSGAEFAAAARESGADLYVTGDVKYHQALDACAGAMVVADIGHGSGEKWILPEFRSAIVRRFGDALAVRVHMDEEPLRPYRPGE